MSVRRLVVLMHDGKTDAWLTVAKKRKGSRMRYIKDFSHSSQREKAQYIISISARNAWLIA